jgi:PTH1 family peptidyl-tRNA hydrolase
VVGLGNRGREYEGTRHNVGADAVRVLARRHGGVLSGDRRLTAECATVTVGGRRVLLAVPRTYMNDSGVAVGALVRRAGLEADGSDGLPSLVVVHDELDLPPGRVKVKVGGGNAGHNGLRSLEQHLHTSGYVRVRIGIGKPPGRMSGAAYVLRRPSPADQEVLGGAVETAADAVERIVAAGVERAMNEVNTGA